MGFFRRRIQRHGGVSFGSVVRLTHVIGLVSRQWILFFCNCNHVRIPDPKACQNAFNISRFEKRVIERVDPISSCKFFSACHHCSIETTRPESQSAILQPHPTVSHRHVPLVSVPQTYSLATWDFSKRFLLSPLSTFAERGEVSLILRHVSSK
jgi:hypothetical protein